MAAALRGCEAGPAIVTARPRVSAPSFGRSVPNRGEVEAPVIRLGKASTLRVRVVDRAGKPVAGAYLRAGTWRGHPSSLRVGAQTDGRMGNPPGTLKPMPQGTSHGQVPRATPCSSISLKMGICAGTRIPDRLGSRARRDAGPGAGHLGECDRRDDRQAGAPFPRDPRLRPTPRRGGDLRGGEHGRGGIHRRSLLDEVRYADEGVVRASRGAWLRAGRIAQPSARTKAR